MRRGGHSTSGPAPAAARRGGYAGHRHRRQRQPAIKLVLPKIKASLLAAKQDKAYA